MGTQVSPALANLDHEYDFIVIGGGTAGLTVAARLVEDNVDVRVLVLEAGQDLSENPAVNVPAMWPQLLETDADWAFKSTSQSQLNERSVDLPQGRVLGGSSAINAQAYIPASKAVLDGWEALGNKGWCWKALAPYFRKSHTLALPDEATRAHLGLDWVSEDIMGNLGPIQVSFPGTVEDPLTKAWVNTFDKLGHRVRQDPYSGSGTGGYSNPATIDPKTKTRSYATSAYYTPNRQNAQLCVTTNASVSKIILERVNTQPNLFRGTGVEVQLQNTREPVIINALKDIILSAGVFQSPKLLELSGVGNDSLLRSLDIPLFIDNPYVGENLQDHVMAGVGLEVNAGVPTISSLQRGEPAAIETAMALYTQKLGPMTAGGVQSHAYMHTLGQDANREAIEKFKMQMKTEYEEVVYSIMNNTNEGSGALFMINCQNTMKHSEKDPRYNPGPLPEDYITLGAIQSHPLSRGSVHITSRDPAKAPSIDPNYFSHPLDLEVFAQHLQFLEKLAATEPLASMLKPQGKRHHPLAYFNDMDAAKNFAQSACISAYHSVGTCAMMPREKGGVVDERLIVYGTENLRVVDASIMPLIPRGNIVSSVYAVAERAADLIKEDYLKD